MYQQKTININDLHLNTGQISGLPKNPRFIKDERFEALKKSIADAPEMLQLRELLVYDNNGEYVIIAGNMRYKAGKELGLKEFPCKVLPISTPVEKLREYTIKDNIAFGQNDWEALNGEWEIGELLDWGMMLDDWKSTGNLNRNESDGDIDLQNVDGVNKTLEERFVIPPFSILNTRDKSWVDRKIAWKSIIKCKGESRYNVIKRSLALRFPVQYKEYQKLSLKGNITFEDFLEKRGIDKNENTSLNKTMSLFDHVLAELMCKWFTPYNKSLIIDPFAGDILKGGVFGKCGHSFIGIELRDEQVKLNREDIKELGLEDIVYYNDDGCNIDKYVNPKSADLIFSCPPYFDLEVYSNDERDASNVSYDEFLKIMNTAFCKSINCLKDNRFAVVVIGDCRDKKTGFYRNMPRDISKIFELNGMPLLTEFILVEAVGSGAIRAKRSFESRKMVKCHQNVLVFYKGDCKEIKNIFPKNIDNINIDEYNFEE